MTLEEDREDSSKYYLSYPQPHGVGMKWANCDINVVEWGNIPKFSALGNLVTPLRLPEFSL